MMLLRECGTYIKLENFSGGPVIDLQTQDKDLFLTFYGDGLQRLFTKARDDNWAVRAVLS